jgi:hypothetical protein
LGIKTYQDNRFWARNTPEPGIWKITRSFPSLAESVLKGRPQLEKITKLPAMELRNGR